MYALARGKLHPTTARAAEADDIAGTKSDVVTEEGKRLADGEGARIDGIGHAELAAMAKCETLAEHTGEIRLQDQPWPKGRRGTRPPGFRGITVRPLDDERPAEHRTQRFERPRGFEILRQHDRETNRRHDRLRANHHRLRVANERPRIARLERGLLGVELGRPELHVRATRPIARRQRQELPLDNTRLGRSSPGEQPRMQLPESSCATRDHALEKIATAVWTTRRYLEQRHVVERPIAHERRHRSRKLGDAHTGNLHNRELAQGVACMQTPSACAVGRLRLTRYGPALTSRRE